MDQFSVTYLCVSLHHCKHRGVWELSKGKEKRTIHPSFQRIIAYLRGGWQSSTVQMGCLCSTTHKVEDMLHDLQTELVNTIYSY